MSATVPLLVLAAAAGWIATPDERGALLEADGHRAVLSCPRPGILRVEVDAPDGTEAVVFAAAQGSVNLRGTTAAGTFASEMPLDGITVLFLRDGGTLRVGPRAAAYEMPWAPPASAIERLARGCGAGA